MAFSGWSSDSDFEDVTRVVARPLNVNWGIAPCDRPRVQEVGADKQQPSKETNGCVRVSSNLPGPVQTGIDECGTGKKTRVRGSKLFFITVDVPEVYDNIREEFVENFSCVESYCVGLEKHKGESKCPYHLHAYLKFSVKVLLGELCDELHTIFDGISVNVQKCKSERNALKYVTKEDKNAYFNVSVDHLSFYYRLHYWGRNTVHFRHDDPFVVEHKHLYRYLEGALSDMHRSPGIVQYLSYESQCFGNWADNVVEWWNNFIGCKGYRRKQLYLWGDSGVGKTTLVEKILGRRMMEYVFEVGDGRFAFDGLRLDFHKVLLFEEFDWDEWRGKRRYLKRLLEGRRFSADLKGRVPMQLSWLDKPIIIVSNELNINDPAILNRLEVVATGDRCFWDYGVRSYVKKEVLSAGPTDDEEEMVTISDSD